MSEIILHEQTGQHLARFVSQPSHALLLVGPSGVGKQCVAEDVARQLLGLESTEALYAYPYFTSVIPAKDKSSIGIEAVRDLQQFVKLKLPVTSTMSEQAWRIILITDAQTLTGEAQNAILKLLEEPPRQTIFLLTSASEQALLPTIRSRTQQVSIHPPSQTDIARHYNQLGFSDEDFVRAYMLSGGLPGLLNALLRQDEHPLKAAVQTARTLLQSTQFERLCMVDELAKKKPETLQILFVLQHMARAAMEQGAKASDGSAAKRIQQWHRVLRAAYEAEKSYAVSGQAKLTLTNLMLAL